MESIKHLTLSTALQRQLLSHAKRVRPKEAVGLLGGSPTGQVKVALPLENIAAGNWEFFADPFAQFCAFRYLESHNLELLAIYHSHPGGGVEPSDKDLAYARRWSCIHLIVAVGVDGESDERLRAFRCDGLGSIDDVEVRRSDLVFVS